MLLQAQTGSGKTVVTAYAIELMQTIDQGQGGFLGLTPEETNIGSWSCGSIRTSSTT